MKVSIITVTYNSDKYLEKCISSVLSQDFPNIEYIIIDGNSTDNTKKIISKYHNNIDIFISESDFGIYDAINKGIRISTGEIIGLLHSDDFFHDNNVISRIVNSFDKDTDAVFADSFFIDIKNKKKRYYSSKNFKNWKFRFGLMPSHPTFYIKRQILKGVDLYNIGVSKCKNPSLSIALCIALYTLCRKIKFLLSLSLLKSRYLYFNLKSSLTSSSLSMNGNGGQLLYTSNSLQKTSTSPV